MDDRRIVGIERDCSLIVGDQSIAARAMSSAAAIVDLPAPDIPQNKTALPFTATALACRTI